MSFFRAVHERLLTDGSNSVCPRIIYLNDVIATSFTPYLFHTLSSPSQPQALHVSTGLDMVPIAHVTLRAREGGERSVSAVGTGPIDAVYQVRKRGVFRLKEPLLYELLSLSLKLLLEMSGLPSQPPWLFWFIH